MRTPSSGRVSTVFAVNAKTISHTPRAATATDSTVNRVATSVRADDALAGSCVMEERLTYSESEYSLFSHDGIHDSQTHLAAPPYFYEQLGREIALSNRSGESFSLVRIIFRRINNSGFETGERIQAVDILHFSQALQDLTRKEDCVARLAINECLIIVRASKSNVEALVTRLLNAPELTVENSLGISCSWVEFLDCEKERAFLDRLDAMALSTL